MTAPQRVQMTRTRPWRDQHPDAVIVARPSKWGNPFTVTDVGRRFPSLTVDQCQSFAVNEFRDLVGWWRLGEQDRSAPRSQTFSLPGLRFGDPRRVVTFTYPSLDEIASELAGRDLACWCPLDQPCHADVLLELATGRGREAAREPNEVTE